MTSSRRSAPFRRLVSLVFSPLRWNTRAKSMQLTAPSELFNFSILDSTWLSSLLHPCLPTENRNEAYAVRQSMFGNRKLLVVHGSTSRRKSWSVDRLQAVLSIFLDEHPEFAVCLIGQTRLPFTTD